MMVLSSVICIKKTFFLFSIFHTSPPQHTFSVFKSMNRNRSTIDKSKLFLPSKCFSAAGLYIYGWCALCSPKSTAIRVAAHAIQYLPGSEENIYSNWGWIWENNVYLTNSSANTEIWQNNITLQIFNLVQIVIKFILGECKIQNGTNLFQL